MFAALRNASFSCSPGGSDTWRGRGAGVARALCQCEFRLGEKGLSNTNNSNSNSNSNRDHGMLLSPREMLHSRHAGGLRSAHPRATYPQAAHPRAAFPRPDRQAWRGRGAGVARAWRGHAKRAPQNTSFSLSSVRVSVPDDSTGAGVARAWRGLCQRPLG